MGLWGYEQEPHSLKYTRKAALSLEWVNQSEVAAASQVLI